VIRLDNVENSIDKSFKDSVASDKALDIAKDFLEVGLDSLLKDGLLKDIPIIGTVIGFGKIAWSIKDKQTLKKIAIFLSRLSNIPLKEREEFAEKLTEDKFKETISEKVILIIERLDETAKAEIVGNLFALYIRSYISKDRFLRFSNIVEKMFIGDLLALSKKSRYSIVNIETISWSEVEKNLLSAGLIDQTLSEKPSRTARGRGLNGVTEPSLEHKLNSLGQCLANIMYYDLNDTHFLEYLEYLKESLDADIKGF
jgi:hypothetical protein